MQQESAKLITQVTRLRSAAAQSVALAQTVQAADGNPAHEWFAPLAEAAKRQFGRPVVAYLDTSASATDGFAHEGIAYVNLSNPEQAVRATIFHELQHVIRREARLGDGQAQLATRMLDQVWGMIDTKAKQAYAAKYLFRDEVRGGTMSIEQALQDPALQDEMLSDFMGRRGNDDGFWAGVAKKSPATFGAFAQRWIGVAQGLIDVLRGRAQDGSIKNIDVAIANLDRAKAVASRVVQAWADANPALAAKQGLTGLVSSDVRQDSGRVSVDGANESVGVNLSVATGSIPKLADLQQRSNAGDEQATALLHRTARNSVTQLMSGIEGASIKTTAQGGLFGGEMEPSLGVNVEFAAQAKPKVLAALARFAENYNQWQIHVLQETDAPPGTAFPDGSYSTVQWTMALKSPMTRAEVQALVDGSGLPGLTYSDKQLSVYYTGGPNNDAGLAEFSQGWKRAAVLVGDKNAGISATTSRLWPYGNSFAGEPTIGFDAIRGEVGAAPIQDNPITRDFAEEHLGEPVTPAQQAPSITPEQRKLQDGIAKAYEAMPLDDLSNPLVRRAYSELSQEVVAQFDALPIKVEMYGDGAEPYANSQAMRSDVADKNHLFIYPTEAATFGPPGVDYESHPLLEDSGRKDVNGRPMLANDLLRAVHDYFAHTLSPTQFGPSGEEAAWTNHMRTTKSPWAKWALTSETRGQNSWVNFRSGVEDTPISQRSFAVQKVGLLPIQYAMTGDAGADAGVQALRETLTEEQSKGSLAKGSTEYATSASDEGSGTIQKGADTGPEAVDVRLLKGLSVRLEVPGSDGQGESFVTVDAGRVVAAYDERIDNLNQLIKCLGK